MEQTANGIFVSLRAAFQEYILSTLDGRSPHKQYVLQAGPASLAELLVSIEHTFCGNLSPL